jgi:hypothetical protein
MFILKIIGSLLLALVSVVIGLCALGWVWGMMLIRDEKKDSLNG